MFDAASQRLATYLGTSVHLMSVMARACGHDDLKSFTRDDLTTWKREMSDLSGVDFGGVSGR